MKKFLIGSIIGLSLIAASVGALSIFSVFQGGTGRSTLPASQLLYGNGTNPIGSVATTSVTAGTGISFTSFTAIGSSPITITSSGVAFPFTVNTNYNSTSTVIGFLNGLFSTASSTFSSNLFLTSLSQGNLYIGINGSVQSSATSSETCSSPLSCTSFDVLKNGGAITLNTVPIASGGTNSTSFSPNSIITASTDGLSLVSTSSQLTVGNLIATTTSTSYFGGSVGIGTTTPWGLLSVNPNALGTSVPEFVVGSSSATHLLVNQSGFVGIGLTNPTSLLNVGKNFNGTLVGETLTNSGSSANNNVSLDFQSANLGTARARIVGVAPGGSDIEIALYTSNNAAAATEKVRINDIGNVGIATTTPQFPLNVVNTTLPQIAIGGGTNTNAWTMRSIGGALYLATSSPSTFATSTATAFYIDVNGQAYFGTYGNCNGTSNALGITSFQLTCDSLVSDQRLKKNIVPITYGLNVLLNINPKSWTWVDNNIPGLATGDKGIQYGIIAQDLQKVAPELVSTTSPSKYTPNGTLTYDHNVIIQILINSVKQMYSQFQASINNLISWNRDQDTSLKKLEDQNVKLEKEIQALQAQINTLKNGK